MGGTQGDTTNDLDDVDVGPTSLETNNSNTKSPPKHNDEGSKPIATQSLVLFLENPCTPKNRKGLSCRNHH
jgi:hypothetical protein